MPEINYIELIKKARRAREYSYSPYSKYKVGAALLTAAGNVYAGCNIENASYSLTICAERAAVAGAVSAGEREFAAIAIAGKNSAIRPCGSCLQVLYEFSPDMTVVIAGDSDDYILYNLRDMLPFPFEL